MWVVLVMMMLALAACPKRKARTECFEATVGENSAGTTALFKARHCQGGGVTWAAIFGVLARRQGSVAPVEEPLAGWTGGVYRLNGKITFSLDDEGDAVQFCADDLELVGSMKREHARLNRDAAALKQAMAQADPSELECFGEKTRLPPMNAIPSAPPQEVAAARAKVAHFEETIRKQPSWCLPLDNGKTATVGFQPNGRIALASGSGSWRVPRPELGDDRVEVVVPGGLFHLDVGASGRLGWADVYGKRTELVPGACPR